MAKVYKYLQSLTPQKSTFGPANFQNVDLHAPSRILCVNVVRRKWLTEHFRVDLQMPTFGGVTIYETYNEIPELDPFKKHVVS